MRCSLDQVFLEWSFKPTQCGLNLQVFWNLLTGGDDLFGIILPGTCYRLEDLHEERQVLYSS